MDKKERRAHGTGCIFKTRRSRFLYIRWYDAQGRRRTEATRTTSRSKAEAILRDKLGQRDRGENPDASRVTYEDLRQFYLDRRKVDGLRSRPKLKHLDAAFGGKRAKQITGKVVTAYERARLESGAARATLNNELAALRRMFRLAVEAKLLLPTHAPVIRVPDPKNARQGFFEKEDFEAVVAELPEYLRPAIRFAYLTGWRCRSEILPLQWRQVNFEAGTVRLEPGTTKNDEGRTFPFDALPELATLLRRQRARTTALDRETGRIIPWVFHRNGQQIHSYRTAWENAIKRASTEERNGVKVVVRPELIGKLVHDLRRTVVRNLTRAGVPKVWAKKLTGHKTDAVFDRYDITEIGELREAVRRLAESGGR